MRYRNIGKKIWVTTCFLLICFTAVTANTTTGDDGKETDFVAKVNDAAISRKDFDRSLAVANQQFETVGTAQGEDTSKIKQEVLDRLIDLELLYQDAGKREITVADSIVDENVRGFVKRLETEENFLNFMKEQNLTHEELREKFRRKIAMGLLQTKLKGELKSGTTVSDEEIAEFYNSNLDRFKEPEQVKASHILIKVAPDADKAAAEKVRQEIDKIRKEIEGGADFAETARARSEGPSNTKGGDLGFFARGRMVKSFEDAAFNLKKGEISEVVETHFGYHLIMVTDKKAARTIPMDEAKEKIERFLSQAKLDQALKEYVKGLRGKAKIVITEKL